MREVYTRTGESEAAWGPRASSICITGETWSRSLAAGAVGGVQHHHLYNASMSVPACSVRCRASDVDEDSIEIARRWPADYTLAT